MKKNYWPIFKTIFAYTLYGMPYLVEIFWISIFELQLIKISFKLVIIWVKYDKKGFFLWNTVYKL